MKMTIRCLPLVLLAACAHSSGGGSHWGYESADGPARWAALDPANAVCATGKEQSPIDLVGATRDPLLKGVDLHWRPSNVTAVDNGHTIQVEVPSDNTLAIDGKVYTLKQFHFHRASEHTLGGRAFPAEIHFVHVADDGKRAVLGVLVEEGSTNAALEALFAALPPKAGKRELAAPLDIEGILPLARGTYRYPGSLTRPPCTEGVSWLMLTAPTSMSAQQIAAVAARYPNNHRPVQPLGARHLIVEGK
jgi:carbonic anhydrase